MEPSKRIENALADAVGLADIASCPSKLGAALRYAVFPGGARVRPRLSLAVAAACGEDDPQLTDAAAASIELLHCASLVHDDLPCFDDAPTRRGKPTVHREYGEACAVLTGDALIVLAFQLLARASVRSPQRLAPLIETVSRGVGVPAGIVAGQGWELESQVPLNVYHQEKTGALFVASVVVGAQSAGADPAPWRVLGEHLGQAYQVADDIRDVAGDPLDLGKPTGRDAFLARPNAVQELGLSAARSWFDELIAEASAKVPDCPGSAKLRALVQIEAQRLVPKEFARRAA